MISIWFIPVGFLWVEAPVKSLVWYRVNLCYIFKISTMFSDLTLKPYTQIFLLNLTLKLYTWDEDYLLLKWTQWKKIVISNLIELFDIIISNLYYSSFL